MAGQAIRVVGICPEKKALRDAYVETVRDLMDLQARELEAVAHHGSLDRFDLAVKRARAQQEAAKTRYVIHSQAHGC